MQWSEHTQVEYHNYSFAPVETLRVSANVYMSTYQGAQRSPLTFPLNRGSHFFPVIYQLLLFMEKCHSVWFLLKAFRTNYVKYVK